MPFESIIVIAAILALFGTMAATLAYAQWTQYGHKPAKALPKQTQIEPARTGVLQEEFRQAA